MWIYTKASLSCLGVSNLTTLPKSKNVFCLFFISVSLVSTNYCFRFLLSFLFLFWLMNESMNKRMKSDTDNKKVMRKMKVGQPDECKASCGCRTSPNQHPSTTVPNSCYEVLGLWQTWCCALWSPFWSCLSTGHCSRGLVVWFRFFLGRRGFLLATLSNYIYSMNNNSIVPCCL